MLKALATWLQNNDRLDASKKVELLLKNSNWEDGVPNFSWLNHGIINNLRLQNPEAFDEFIELNSDKFAVWNPVKYLGSGLVGDAWLLDDNRILKIFDDGAQVFNKSDTEKYDDIIDAQYEGSADPNIPMIYEHGLLEMPSEFYNMKSPSRKNIGGYYRPGYVIMEKVDTPADKARQYIDYNPELLEPGFVYDEETEDYQEKEYSAHETRPLSEEEIPFNLREHYHDALADGNYDDFMESFVKSMFDYIITDMIYVVESAEERFYYPEDEETDEEDEDDEHAGEDADENKSLEFKDNVNADSLVREMTDAMDFSEYYDEESLNALERILNLPRYWEKRLASAILNNFLRGRKDLHSDNFGFRNNQFVFFDA